LGRWGKLNQRVLQDWTKGQVFYPFAGHTKYNNFQNESAKLDVILQSPAPLTVLTLNCDLFSLGKVQIKDLDGQILDKHPLYDILENPNFFQSQNDILWDYMFWNMLGNAYLSIDNRSTLVSNKLYFLNPAKMDFPQNMINDADKLMLSQTSYNQFINSNITYRYDNGKTTKINYKKILHFADQSQTTNAWFKGSSRIDALYKVISNSELSLDAKNIELLFNGKFMVSGKVGENDLDQPMMSNDDKNDIEQKVIKDKPVTAVRKMVDIKKFVDSLQSDKLFKSYMSDVFTIGRMFNIPKDVIEVMIDSGAKYENKKLATADHVDYALQPKGNQLINGLIKYFGFEDVTGCLDWSHLPFMQVRQRQRYEAELDRARALREYLNAGMDAEDAVRLLNLELEKPIEYERVRQTSTQVGANNG